MYTEVLEEMEQFINVTWQHFTDVVSQDTRSLVAEACEVYRVSQYILGDFLDRKLAQVEYAAKEEKDHLANFTRKWEGLDPGADYEKDKAKHARMVKVAALGGNYEKSVIVTLQHKCYRKLTFQNFYPAEVARIEKLKAAVASGMPIMGPC